MKNAEMRIKKFWLDEEYYAFVISDSDQRVDYPTTIDVLIGRKGFGDLHYSYGTTQDFSEITEDEIYCLYCNGYFEPQIAWFESQIA